jgi:hypothetical protein
MCSIAIGRGLRRGRGLGACLEEGIAVGAAERCHDGVQRHIGVLVGSQRSRADLHDELAHGLGRSQPRPQRQRVHAAAHHGARCRMHAACERRAHLHAIAMFVTLDIRTTRSRPM